MEEFPFTDDEWAVVGEAARQVVNATLADDEPLHASRLLDLQDVLDALRRRYGEHPVLLETEADFAASPAESIPLYRRAESIAVAHNLPTLSIRLDLASCLIDMRQLAEARQVLLSCRSEAEAAGCESDRTCWSELLAKTGSAAVPPAR